MLSKNQEGVWTILEMRETQLYMLHSGCPVCRCARLQVWNDTRHLVCLRRCVTRRVDGDVVFRLSALPLGANPTCTRQVQNPNGKARCSVQFAFTNLTASTIGDSETFASTMFHTYISYQSWVQTPKNASTKLVSSVSSRSAALSP